MSSQRSQRRCPSTKRPKLHLLQAMARTRMERVYPSLSPNLMRRTLCGRKASVEREYDQHSGDHSGGVSLHFAATLHFRRLFIAKSLFISLVFLYILLLRA